MAVLETGASANPASPRWLERHDRILEQKAYRTVSTYPSSARFRSGHGRLGEVCHAAYIPVGIAGSKGNCTALALDAEILALLRRRDSPGGSGRATRFPTRYTDFAQTRGEYPPESAQDGALDPDRARFRERPIKGNERPRGFSVVFSMRFNVQTSRFTHWRITFPIHGEWAVSV